MTTHVFPSHAESQTATDVLWRCNVCRREIGFNKPGVGEPSATYTAYPANIDDYLDVCPGTYEYVGRELSRDKFLLRLTSTELGALSRSQDDRVRGMYERIKLSDVISLDDPVLISDLSYATEFGMIFDAGRPAEIVA